MLWYLFQICLCEVSRSPILVGVGVSMGVVLAVIVVVKCCWCIVNGVPQVFIVN